MPAPFDRNKKFGLLIGDFVLIVLVSCLSAYIRLKRYMNVPDYYTAPELSYSLPSIIY